ncbi:MAG: TraR/DksA family transcriptional regulator [Deltaproteobacteria bacterium]|jgi:DnaK suppressor protein|nr:TraR/DksA family transcriptional regulator [Deltaproteobacteria bacterium]
MTNAQRSALNNKILAELERLAQDIKALEELTRPVDGKDMDDITRMDSIVNQGVNSTALAAARNRLAGLEYALKRIQEPDFGYCLECGEEIPFARLLAMPESAYCVNCAS